MTSLCKHCDKCGIQLHRESKINLCSGCLLEKPKCKCSFCSETNCPVSVKAFFPTIGKSIYVDFRADMEYNQIDCQFGILNEKGESEWGEWSDNAIDICYCPVCGRKLEEVE